MSNTIYMNWFTIHNTYTYTYRTSNYITYGHTVSNYSILRVYKEMQC